MIWWWDRPSKYVEKRDQGIVFYKRPRDEKPREHKKPRFNRQIMSLRIFTHTKK